MTDDERRRMLEREAMLTLNTQVWNSFRQNLMNNPEAMKYVLSRGWGQEIINTFGIGFAPEKQSAYRYAEKWAKRNCP